VTTALAPALGRLAAPPNPHAPFEAIRLALVDRLVRARHHGTLDDDAWLDEWRTATDELAHAVLDEARGAMQRAAAVSRFPARRLAVLLPDRDYEQELRTRLQAEGVPLERLAGIGAGARQRGAALESAWDAAVRVASIERHRLQAVASELERWRRPWRPFVIVAAAALVFTTALAALLGGVLPAPAWFQPVTDWFWGLPWP
jgi:hypothetical protein